MSCILCKSRAVVTRQDLNARSIYNCKKCGMYVVSDVVEEEVAQNRFEVMAYVRSRKLSGSNDLVLITYDNAQVDKEYAQLSVGQILSLFPHSFPQQMDMALRNLAHLSEYPGHEVRIENLDAAPLFYVRHDGFEAMSYVIKAMHAAGLIEVNYYGATFFPCAVVISPSGWERLAGLSPISGQRRRIMLASSQRSSDRGLEVLKTAQKVAREEGMELLESARAIDTGIGNALAAEVRHCDLLICDLGGAGPEVYYAAGYAHALGKPVVTLCHESELEEMEVDPAEQGVLQWQEKKQLGQLLRNYIGAKL